VVTLTDIALEKVGAFLAAQDQAVEAGLRVAVKGGGCSGFQYALALDEIRDGDRIFESGGIRVIVDQASLPYVDGSVVDYQESLMGAGFEVKNPNVVASCGCGSSFRVKDEDAVCG
jgi:iron-sulfur cluster assembly protein